MYNQNSDLMKQEKFMLPTMIEGDFSAEELAEDADGVSRFPPAAHSNLRCRPMIRTIPTMKRIW
jgi:hypothetical protein